MKRSDIAFSDSQPSISSYHFSIGLWKVFFSVVDEKVFFLGYFRSEAYQDGKNEEDEPTEEEHESSIGEEISNTRYFPSCITSPAGNTPFPKGH